MDTIYITGIGGAWSTEFVKQLLPLGYTIKGIDRSEVALAEVKRKYPDIDVTLGDFGDVNFEGMGVDVLIHTGAYKFINICELNIAETVENNVMKTAKLYESATKHGVKMLFISTDKACYPVSIYGLTKTLGERLTWSFGGSVTRSGNIVGSNGSVVNIWREAIKNKQPLKVTSMDMERYFINVEDAVAISWKGFLDGNKLTIVDKGGRLKLGDIINKVLLEFGYTVETYKPGIETIGIRPGERLIDEITWEYDREYLDESKIKEQREKLNG